MNDPKDYDIEIRNLFYKIGRHGRPFVWIDGEWVISTTPTADIRTAIDRKNNPKPPTKKASLKGGIIDKAGNIATRHQIVAACKKMKLSLKTMRQRIYTGMLIPEAFTTPKMTTTRKIVTDVYRV